MLLQSFRQGLSNGTKNGTLEKLSEHGPKAERTLLKAFPVRYLLYSAVSDFTCT